MAPCGGATLAEKLMAARGPSAPTNSGTEEGGEGCVGERRGWGLGITFTADGRTRVADTMMWAAA